MDKIPIYAAIFAGIFIVVFVITFLRGLGQRILRWTVITALAYLGIIMAVRATHLGGDSAPITMENLISMSLSSSCPPGISTASRSSACPGSTK